MVKRYIFSLPENQIFTTRDLLQYGKRSAIDICLFRLVKDQTIRRLARGVFVRSNHPNKYFSPFEIAQAKANAFEKIISLSGETAALKSGLISATIISSHSQITFYTSGRSSSFKEGDLTIKLKSVSPRKNSLPDSKAGNFLRGYWHLGKGKINNPRKELMRISLGMLKPERLKLKSELKVMPVWITKELEFKTEA